MRGHETSAEQVLELARSAGVLRVRDLTARGIHPEVLRRLHGRGLMVRTARGMYTLAEDEPTENRTVADCFKYRKKVGLDVALEALRDCRGQRRASMDEIWRAAQVCRVANVMRPYLESLT